MSHAPDHAPKFCVRAPGLSEPVGQTRPDVRAQYGGNGYWNVAVLLTRKVELNRLMNPGWGLGLEHRGSLRERCIRDVLEKPTDSPSDWRPNRSDPIEERWANAESSSNCTSTAKVLRFFRRVGPLSRTKTGCFQSGSFWGEPSVHYSLIQLVALLSLRLGE